VLGQFHEQATQWLRPGAYRYKQLGGASKAERMATYRDPETHMVMVSHDTMRDDMRDMVAAAHGWSPAEARERILAADDAEVDKMLSTALQKHGAEKLLDYYSIDEGHMTLNRQGKPDSLLAKISDSLLRQSKGGNIMSGTLAKNDETEVFDILHKLDPQRWKDMGDFNRRFPKGSNVSRDALRRTIDSYIYASAIDPGTKPVRMTRKLDLHPMQKARMAEIDQAHDSIAEAHRALRLGIGNADEHRQKLRESAQKLWPPAFTKTSPDEHDRVAQGIAEALPTMRRQAYNDAIHGAPVEGNAKFQAALETAEMYQRNDPGEIFDHLVKHGAKTEADRDEFMRDAEQSQHKGKPAPGVFFLRSIAGGAKLAAALQAKGLRVQHFKGSLTPGQKAQAQRDFRDGKFDVMVASDAAADGLNLQRGRYLAQLDTPDTYRVYEQRNGRINRLGQKEREPHIYDFVADHPHEVRERERLQSKKGLHSVIHDVSESIDDTGLAHHLHRVREEKKARHGDPYYPMPAEVGAA
jgi:hypothetical protein